MSRVEELKRFFEPMVSKLREKIAEKYAYEFMSRIQEIDGFDVTVDVRVDVHFMRDENGKPRFLTYNHSFMSREFLTARFREQLMKENNAGQPTSNFS